MHATHNKQCRIQNTETDVHKITNVPVFFYMALGPNVLRHIKPTGALKVK
jgi:hypothetical protein